MKFRSTLVCSLAFALLLALSACQADAPLFGPGATRTFTPAPSATAEPTRTASPTATPTRTHTSSPTATITPTPTITLTATVTPTPTRDFPDAVIQMQANCRYGPGTAYLYSHGLYKGDTAEVHGRTPSGTWLWIQPFNLERHCWAAASVMQVSGDVLSVPVVTSRLPHTTFVGPPQGVRATRSGDRVQIRWDPISFRTTEEHGYLIEATVCQNGAPVWMAVQTPDTEYEFTDEENGCQASSGGLLYAFEKHGYTDPVTIPWP